MRRVRVVTDSTADLPREVAEELGITVVPLSLYWSGDVYRDNVDITRDEFFRRLRTDHDLPRTSQPSGGQFLELYQQLLDDADSIISIHLSGGYSGTCDTAFSVARMIDPSKIAVVDSRSVLYPMSRVVVEVAKLARDGASLEECRALADEIVPRLRLYFAVDDVDYLRRGGRIGRAQALLAGALSIKPIIQVLGETVPVERVRTRASAVRRLAELIAELGPLEHLALLFSDDPSPAEQIGQILREKHPDIPFEWGSVGSVIGTHAGPGAYGFGAVLSESPELQP